MALELISGSPDDFDFAIGDWRVKHRRLKDRLVGSDQWVEFDGQMSTQKILGGFGNVEDNLPSPAGLELPAAPCSYWTRPRAPGTDLDRYRQHSAAVQRLQAG